MSEIKKVLICDDLEDIRSVLEDVISIEYDAEVFHAVNGVEGITHLGTDTVFDLVISDMNMPVSIGLDVYKYNRANNKYPFVLLTSDFDINNHDFTGIDTEPGNHFLAKPWEMDELLELLNLVLGKNVSA